jgi:hypothetical protein
VNKDSEPQEILRWSIVFGCGAHGVTRPASFGLRLKAMGDALFSAI